MECDEEDVWVAGADIVLCGAGALKPRVLAELVVENCGAAWTSAKPFFATWLFR